MELKRWDRKSPFTANGVNYIICQGLSIRRRREYEKLVPELALGINLDQLWKGLEIIEKFNEARNHNGIAVQVYNMKFGIKDVLTEPRYEAGLRMAALIINREDEDPAKYDPNLMMQKMNDWEQEGFSNDDFFIFALNTINGFRGIYEEYIRQQAEIVSKSDLMKNP